MELPGPEPVEELPPAPEPEPVPVPASETAWEPEPESVIEEPAMPEPPSMPAVNFSVTVPPPVAESPVADAPVVDSILSESDFDSAVNESKEQELTAWSMPGLPNVAALPEMGATPPDMDSDAEDQEEDSDADFEPSSVIASQLDVTPLNLATPALPVQSEPMDMSEEDEQEIESLLATMMTPVTAGVVPESGS
jgi:hypothetical protein